MKLVILLLAMAVTSIDASSQGMKINNRFHRLVTFRFLFLKGDAVDTLIYSNVALLLFRPCVRASVSGWPFRAGICHTDRNPTATKLIIYISMTINYIGFYKYALNLYKMCIYIYWKQSLLCPYWVSGIHENKITLSHFIDIRSWDNERRSILYNWRTGNK